MSGPGRMQALKLRARSGRSALMIVAVILFGSALVRAASGAGAALAREVANLGAPAQAGAMAEPVSCTTEDDIADLLESLRARETGLVADERALAQQQRAIETARSELAANVAALEEAERRLAATLAIADQAAEGDIARLTAVYENMKPAEAATLFQEMPPDFAAGFLGRMRPDAAAAVMAGLAPQTAYAISVVLAGRNANVPRE